MERVVFFSPVCGQDVDLRPLKDDGVERVTIRAKQKWVWGIRRQLKERSCRCEAPPPTHTHSDDTFVPSTFVHLCVSIPLMTEGEVRLV